MVAGQAKKLGKTPVAEFDWPINHPEEEQSKPTPGYLELI
jgi:hypothetical protein